MGGLGFGSPNAEYARNRIERERLKIEQKREERENSGVISTMQIQADMIADLKSENDKLKDEINKLKFQLHEFTKEV